MDGLKIIPGPGVPEGLRIPESELSERFSRSSGPGGQHVNSTDSRVQLSFDLAATDVLGDVRRHRVLRNLASRLDGTVLTVTATAERSQLRNRRDARERMAAMLRAALAPAPSPRRKTKPTRGSVRRQRRAKLHRSELKAGRRRPDLP